SERPTLEPQRSFRLPLLTATEHPDYSTLGAEGTWLPECSAMTPDARARQRLRSTSSGPGQEEPRKRFQAPLPALLLRGRSRTSRWKCRTIIEAPSVRGR